MLTRRSSIAKAARAIHHANLREGRRSTGVKRHREDPTIWPRQERAESGGAREGPAAPTEARKEGEEDRASKRMRGGKAQQQQQHAQQQEMQLNGYGTGAATSAAKRQLALPQPFDGGDGNPSRWLDDDAGEETDRAAADFVFSPARKSGGGKRFRVPKNEEDEEEGRAAENGGEQDDGAVMADFVFSPAAKRRRSSRGSQPSPLRRQL